MVHPRVGGVSLSAATGTCQISSRTPANWAGTENRWRRRNPARPKIGLDVPIRCRATEELPAVMIAFHRSGSPKLREPWYLYKLREPCWEVIGPHRQTRACFGEYCDEVVENSFLRDASSHYVTWRDCGVDVHRGQHCSRKFSINRR